MRATSEISRGRTVVIAVLLVELALAAVGAWLWADDTFADEELPGDPPTPAPEVPRPLILETGYPIAAQRAAAWDADARLIMVGAQLDWPLEVPPGPAQELPGGGWLTYVFAGEPGGEEALLSMLVERYSGRIVQERITPWSGGAPVGRLELLELPVGSAEAAIAAEAAVGTEFRRACPAARHVTRISLGLADSAAADGGGVSRSATPAAQTGAEARASSAEAGGSLLWLVGYRDVRDDGRIPLLVSVDAITSEVRVDQRSLAEIEGCPM